MVNFNKSLPKMTAQHQRYSAIRHPLISQHSSTLHSTLSNEPDLNISLQPHPGSASSSTSRAEVHPAWVTSPLSNRTNSNNSNSSNWSSIPAQMERSRITSSAISRPSRLVFVRKLWMLFIIIILFFRRNLNLCMFIWLRCLINLKLKLINATLILN